MRTVNGFYVRRAPPTPPTSRLPLSTSRDCSNTFIYSAWPSLDCSLAYAPAVLSLTPQVRGPSMSFSRCQADTLAQMILPWPHMTPKPVIACLRLVHPRRPCRNRTRGRSRPAGSRRSRRNHPTLRRLGTSDACVRPGWTSICLRRSRRLAPLESLGDRRARVPDLGLRVVRAQPHVRPDSRLSKSGTPTAKRRRISPLATRTRSR